MKLTAATLVVLTAANGCKLDNIDGAEPVALGVETMEICQEKAAALDAKNGVRAFCIPVQQ